MTAAPGLRERKKEQTRRRIADVALALFGERGFDRVRVSDVALAADVSEATVYNYFPTKEDLVLGGIGDFGAELLESIEQRPTGTSVIDAFGAFVLRPRGALASPNRADTERVAAMARIITESADLQAGEQQAFEGTTHALARVVAEESGADPRDILSWVEANAMTGIIRAMSVAVRRHSLEGRFGQQVADDVVSSGQQALDALRNGLANRAAL